MLGLLVIIVVSWVLLHFIEKKNISVLGIIPNQKHIIQFLIGVLFIVVVMLVSIYLQTLVKSIIWEDQPINYGVFFKSIVYHLRSALTEDLVFRGALLYILISRLGAKWAILISALCFGVYHVFSYEMDVSRIIPLLYVILITGFTGYVWAYAFAKTNSIALGLGLHLGINMVQVCFYPSQPYGELLFAEISQVDFSEWNNFYFSIVKGLFPSVLTLIFLKLLFKPKFNFIKSNNEGTSK